MIRGLYVFWALLPAILWFFAAKASYGKMLRKPLREEPNVYFPQAIFCSVALALTIVLEMTLYDSIAEMISFGFVDINLFRWLLYPTVLVFLAYVQSIIYPEKKVRLRPKSPYAGG